jgi:hypothetical protein
MNTLFSLTVLATVIDGLFAGIALQKLVVELPARKKIGTVAFVRYFRASDLENGRFIYPPFVIVGFLLKGLIFILAEQAGFSINMLIPLVLAIAFNVGILIMTAFAAPQMINVRKIEDKEELLSPKLEKFVTYSFPRAIFMMLQFGAILWTLILLR